MSAAPDLWIIVPNWSRFQHPDTRTLTWIKLYTELNSRDEWLELSTAARGMLVTIWIEYARSGGHLRVEKCMQLCGKSARSKHLEALNHAGFIRLVTSRQQVQRREEKEKRRTKTTGKNEEPELLTFQEFLGGLQEAKQ